MSARDMFLISPENADHADIAILGDSHALMLYSGLTRFTNRSVMMVGRGTCPPFLDVDVERVEEGATASLACQPLTNNYLSHAKSDPGIKVVVLNAFYRQYGRDVRMTSRGRDVEMGSAVLKTVSYLAESGKVVVVSLDVPELPRSCFRRNFPVWNVRQHGDCVIDRQLHVASNRVILESVEAVRAREATVALYDPSEVLCDRDQCGEIDQSHVLYLTDGNHVNSYAGARIGRDLSQFLERILTSLSR